MSKTSRCKGGNGQIDELSFSFGREYSVDGVGCRGYYHIKHPTACTLTRVPVQVHWGCLEASGQLA